MRSAVPKVLHEVAGRPMLSWVLAAARQAGCDRIVVIVGHGAEAVRRAVAAPDVSFVLQEEQLGTGHAVLQAETVLAGDELLLVLSGDVPLVTSETLERLAQRA
ncbi:MAG: NTP transferase domain-containing protein, partial [Acidobacteria bacterium]|nr:NTP transferase domain-containing protein [Acidobacteriota bacterium]